MLKDTDDKNYLSDDLKDVILDTIKDPIFVWNKDGNFIYINDPACKALGCNKDDVPNMKEFHFDYNAPKNKGSIVYSGKDGSFSFKTGIFYRNRMINQVMMDTSLVELNGSKYYLGIIRDMKENKKLTKENTGRTAVAKSIWQSVDAISTIIEAKDPYTALHQKRVSNLACGIAAELDMEPFRITGIGIAALLHDIGKIYVPSEILVKPGRISDNEFNIIKTHSQIGCEILKKVDFPWPVADTVLQHHEKVNGSGYPYGITSGEILLESKILCVADVVEAMSSHRPYRAALGIDKALEEISNNRNKLFDSDVVEACLSLFAGKKYDIGSENRFLPR